MVRFVNLSFFNVGSGLGILELATELFLRRLILYKTQVLSVFFCERTYDVCLSADYLCS